MRPWSLHRNGHLGIARWGGWVWSGDTQSTWKTLEGQIAVGINHSLSLSPFWGSDTGGFYTTSELTGELYARWFQFSAFCPSFRSHGRIWRLRLPWGWGLSDMGFREGQNDPPSQSEMNNPAIEPICKQYAELRYQLIPYTYTLAAEARDTGMPLMRAMWLHYPNDERARGTRHAIPVGPRPAGRPGLHKGRVHARRVPARRRLVRLVDRRKDKPAEDRHPLGRPGDDADLRPRRRDHSPRSGAAIHDAARR